MNDMNYSQKIKQIRKKYGVSKEDLTNIFTQIPQTIEKRNRVKSQIHQLARANPQQYRLNRIRQIEKIKQSVIKTHRQLTTLDSHKSYTNRSQYNNFNSKLRQQELSTLDNSMIAKEYRKTNVFQDRINQKFNRIFKSPEKNYIRPFQTIESQNGQYQQMKSPLKSIINKMNNQETPKLTELANFYTSRQNYQQNYKKENIPLYKKENIEHQYNNKNYQIANKQQQFLRSQYSFNNKGKYQKDFSFQQRKVSSSIKWQIGNLDKLQRKIQNALTNNNRY